VSHTDPFGDVFLVVDGWAACAVTSRLLRGGGGHCCSRAFVRSARGLVSVALGGAQTIVEGSDRQPHRVTAGRSRRIRNRPQAGAPGSPRQAGRGLSRDGLHMLIALPRLDGVESTTGLAEAVVRVGDMLRHRHGESAAPPVPLLPTKVDHEALLARAGDEICPHILLGLEERRLQPVAVDFGHHSHLLVFGDKECGKTATLRILCARSSGLRPQRKPNC